MVGGGGGAQAGVVAGAPEATPSSGEGSGNDVAGSSVPLRKSLKPLIFSRFSSILHTSGFVSGTSVLANTHSIFSICLTYFLIPNGRVRVSSRGPASSRAVW